MCRGYGRLLEKAPRPGRDPVAHVGVPHDEGPMGREGFLGPRGGNPVGVFARPGEVVVVPRGEYVALVGLKCCVSSGWVLEGRDGAMYMFLGKRR